jgi:hypothetical protein
MLTMNAVIEIDNLDAFVADDDHRARLGGTVSYPPLREDLPLAEGTFQLLAQVAPAKG